MVELWTSQEIYWKNLLVLLYVFFMGCTYSPPSPRTMYYTDPGNKQIVKDIRAGLEENKTDTASRYRLVDIFLSEYFFEDAITEIETLIRLNPNDLKAYQLLALVLIKSERTDYAGAITVLEKAIRIAPHHSGLRTNLALVYAETNQVSLAKQECATALSLSTDPHEIATIYLILASIDKEQAKEYHRIAVLNDPSVASSDTPIITVPVYVGEKPFFHFSTHPSWKVRLANIDSLNR